MIFRRLLTECDNLKSALLSAESDLQTANSDLSATVTEFNKQFAEFRDKESVWTEEKEELAGQVLILETKVAELVRELEGKQTEMAVLKGQLRVLEGQQREIAGLKQRLSQAEDREQSVQTTLKSVSVELDAHKDDYDHRISQMLTDRKRSNELLSQKEAVIEGKTSELLSLRRTNLDLQNRITTLEQLCCGKEDLHILLERLTSECQVREATTDFLSSELHRVVEYLLCVANGKLEMYRNSTVVAEVMAGKDGEIDSLRQQIAKLRKKGPPYVPVKDDAVDAALADYVNTREDPLLVPFKREQPEIYSFGTKRTHMKLENCRLAVRVGGGYKLLDEFIEEYTPVELAKREKMFNRTASVEGRGLNRSATELPGGQEEAKRKTASPTKGRK